MRPHLLRMTAFGPFPGTVEVDLDRLAGSGLFLLHGETGAGKTTLLDGLGFALYGRVPGARGRTARLRSDHAGPDVRTEVELEVTLGGRRWRIRRSPAQERAKTRGTGTTTEQAKVLLQVRRDGDWDTVSTRLDEAGAELDALLGMSADQFFQVVLLPQGEFARFLRAESRQRGELLQRLFATERFQEVENWLAGRRAATAATVAAARQDLEVLSARLAQAAGGQDDDALPSDAPAAEGGAVDLAQEVLREAVRQRDAALAQAQHATADRDAARAAAAEAAGLDERQARRREALTTRDALARDQAAYELLGEQLLAAARAAELTPVLDEALLREQARAQATAAEAGRRARLPEVGLPVDLGVAGLRTALTAARERSGRLDGLREVDAELAAERRAADLAGREAAACQAEAGRTRVRLTGLPARRAEAQARVRVCRAALVELPRAEAAAAAAGTAVDEARSLARAVALIADLRDQRLLARETAVSLREKEAELRDARLTSMVAELADTLEPGVPCEVCGSTTHPDPYEGRGEGVSREDEDRAREAAEQAARDVAAVEARLEGARAEAAGARERLLSAGVVGLPAADGDRPGQASGEAVLDVDLAALEQHRDRLSARVAQLRALAGELDAAAAVAEHVEAERVRDEAELARCSADASAAGRRREEALQRADRSRTRLEAELGGAPDLAGALSVTARTAQVCEEVLEAAEQALRTGQEATRAAAAAATAAGAAGLDPDEARAARRTASWRDQAQARRRAHEDRHAAVEAALADPRLDVALVPAADVAGTARRVQTADAALAVAVGVLAGAERRAREVGELAPRVSAAVTALAPLEEEATRVKRLADLCGGGGSNALRMTLTSFVLAARLEEVAEAASTRLLRMTQGRYALVHTDGAAKGGVRSGLGLLVRDSWTGRDRDTSTLSGGETFQASLALALGLADVVQAEAGGTRIEALFVDEGFGSLDDETLDEVMDVLDGLREGGRVVGLVSHVAELKARIPAQVHVRKGRAGSTLAVLGC